MKRYTNPFVLAFILSAAVICGLFAAAAPGTWTQGPTTLWRYQSDPVFAPDSATLTAAPVNAYFGYTLTNASAGSSQFFQAGDVSFDLVASGTETVTVDGVTLTYLQLANFNGKAAADQWTKKLTAAAAH